MGLTNAQRRQNIQSAISNVQAAHGGTTGGVSKGASVKGYSGGGGGDSRLGAGSGSTQITYNVDSGKTEIVKTTRENLARIQTGRLIALRQRTQVEILQKQGYNVRTDKSGNVRAEKNGRVLLIRKTPLQLPGAESIEAIRRQASTQNRQALILKTKVQPFLMKGAPTKTVDKLKNTRWALVTAKNDLQRLAEKRGLSAVYTSKRAETAKEKKLKTEYARLERNIKDIGELEKQAAARAQRSVDIFRALPGLKGDNFAQQTARNLLAIPFLTTVGVGEQAVIGGFKLAENLRALKFKAIRENVKAESGRAAREIPITIAKSYDPRTPEGLANIIATGIAYKMAKSGTTKVKGGTVRNAAAAAGKKIKAQIKITKSPAKLSVLKRVYNGLNSLKSQPTFSGKVKIAAVGILRQIRKPIKAIRKPIKAAAAKRSVKLATAKELIRKIEINKRAINARKQQFKITKVELKKAGATKGYRKIALKSIAKKISNLERSNKQFTRAIRKSGVSPLKQLALKRSLGKIPKVKIPKAPKVKPQQISKTYLRIRAKPAFRPAAAKIARVSRALSKKTKAILRKQGIKIERLGRVGDLLIAKKASAAIRKLTANYNKVSKFKQIQIKRTIRQFRNIKNPTVKAVNRLAKRTKQILKGKARAVERLGRRGDVLLERKVNRIINQYKIKRTGKLIRKKLTAPIERKMIRLSKALDNSLKRNGGRLTKAGRMTLKALKKISPFEFKILRTKIGRIKPGKLTGRRSPTLRFKRRTALVANEKVLVKAILKGKTKLKPGMSARVRKLVRRALIQAEKKRAAGLRAAPLRRIKGRILKQLRRKGEISTTLQRIAKRKGIKRVVDLRRAGRLKKILNKQARERIRLIKKARTGISRKLTLTEAANKYTRLKKIRNSIKGTKKAIKRDPFSPRERLKEIARLNQVDRAAANAQGQLQNVANGKIQILKEGKLKRMVTTVKNKRLPTNKRITVAKAIKKATAKLKNNLKQARRMNLEGKSKLLSRQIAVLELGAIPAYQNIRGRFARQTPTGVLPRTKQPQEVAPIQRPIQNVVPGAKEKVITVPEEVPQNRIDTKTDQQIINIIEGVLISVAGTQYIINRNGTLKPVPDRIRGGNIFRLKGWVYNKIKNKRFVYLPDIYSIIFGVRARPGQRLKLLKRGRIFTGAERRAIVEYMR